MRLVLLTVVLLAGHVFVSAQPAGSWLARIDHATPQCSLNQVRGFTLLRQGMEYSCVSSGVGTNEWTYTTCNSTHKMTYTSSSDTCAGASAPRGMYRLRNRATVSVFYGSVVCAAEVPRGPSATAWLSTNILEDNTFSTELCLTLSSGFLPNFVSVFGPNQKYAIDYQFQVSYAGNYTCNTNGPLLASIVSATEALNCAPHQDGRSFQYTTCNDTDKSVSVMSCTNSACTSCFILGAGAIRGCDYEGTIYPTFSACVTPVAAAPGFLPPVGAAPSARVTPSSSVAAPQSSAANRPTTVGLVGAMTFALLVIVL